MGNDHVRAEIDRSGSTSVNILNAGQAAYTSESGKLIRLNLLNTITERVEHIPTFSLIADADRSHLQSEYLGADQLNGVVVQKIALSWSNAVTESDQEEFLKRTRVIYTIATSTYAVLQIEYTRCAEEDSNAMMHYLVSYTNYTELGGRSIPSTVTTYLNGAFLSELKITSYQENSSVPSTAFELPEVTR